MHATEHAVPRSEEGKNLVLQHESLERLRHQEKLLKNLLVLMYDELFTRLEKDATAESK